MTTTIKIGKNTYTNNTKTHKILKNEEIIKNYSIIDITEDGTIVYKNGITIGSYNKNTITDKEYLEFINQLQKQNNTTEQKHNKTTTKKNKKTTKKDKQ